MIDKFDYAEPACPLCGGEEFYYPKRDAPLGRISIDRIIGRVDMLFDKNDYKEARRLLEYWRGEAVNLCDKQGELAIESELIVSKMKEKMGLSRFCGLSVLGNIGDTLQVLTELDNSEKNIAIKQEVIEDIASLFIAEFKALGLSEAVCGDLEKHAYSILDGVRDSNIRNMHIMEGI